MLDKAVQIVVIAEFVPFLMSVRLLNQLFRGDLLQVVGSGLRVEGYRLLLLPFPKPPENQPLEAVRIQQIQRSGTHRRRPALVQRPGLVRLGNLDEHARLVPAHALGAVHHAGTDAVQPALGLHWAGVLPIGGIEPAARIQRPPPNAEADSVRELVAVLECKGFHLFKALDAPIIEDMNPLRLQARGPLRKTRNGYAACPRPA